MAVVPLESLAKKIGTFLKNPGSRHSLPGDVGAKARSSASIQYFIQIGQSSKENIIDITFSQIQYFYYYRVMEIKFYKHYCSQPL